MRSMCGVSIGTNPKLANVSRKPASIRSRGIITEGGTSRSPLATRGSIMTGASFQGPCRRGIRVETSRSKTGRAAAQAGKPRPSGECRCRADPSKPTTRTQDTAKSPGLSGDAVR